MLPLTRFIQSFITEFYNWVLSHTELQCTSEEYESALTTYGECAKYVIGGGYLRLPKKALSHGTVIKEKKPTDTDHTWYRQWSDGWLEQGGLVTVSGTVGATVTLLKPFANTGYNIQLTLQTTNAVGYISAAAQSVSIANSKTTTSFGVQTAGIQNYEINGISWRADGQGADGAQEETLYPWVVAYAAAIPASTAQAAEFQQGLSGKADTNLGNLSTAGKDLASGLGMPSNRYIDLTLGASGSTYTAPANGYISILCAQTGHNGWIRLWTTNGISFWLQQNASNYTMSSFIPVLKGVNVIIDYDSVALTSNGYLRFIYAEGAE